MNVNESLRRFVCPVVAAAVRSVVSVLSFGGTVPSACSKPARSVCVGPVSKKGYPGDSAGYRHRGMQVNYGVSLALSLAFVLLAAQAQSQTTAISGMHHRDIGPSATNPIVPGTVNETSAGNFDVTATGNDIWDAADAFHFVFEELLGDFDVRVRVQSLTRPDHWTKAALMARETLTAPSRHVMFAVTPTEGQNEYAAQQRRSTGGGSTEWTPARSPEPAYPNAWIRLQREGDLFIAYRSDDGEDWERFSENTIEFPERIFVGMALTSHNNSVDGVATAEFRDYSREGTVWDGPTISNFEQDGEAATFSVITEVDAINEDGITVFLNGFDRTSDLILSGDSSQRDVRLEGIQPQRFYQVSVEAADSRGFSVAEVLTFNTVVPEENFTWEANDWNYGGGQFFDDPGIDFSDPRNYFDRMGVAGVDEHTISTAGNDAYRLGSAVGTEPSGDVPREPWASDNRQDAIQYNVGWVAQGEWLNYTRTFPAGEYYVYGRLARDGNVFFAAQLDRVTSDRTQPDQTTEKLGTFRANGTGGWQNYRTLPLVDDDGNLVKVSLGGVETLRVTAASGGYNANYYMLIPADADLPRLTDLSVRSGDAIDARDGISFGIASNAGVPRENIRLLLNGEDRTGNFTITGEENQWTVSFNGLEGATPYRLEVHAADANGNNQFLFAGEPFQVAFETAMVIPAVFSTPPGSGRDPGFTVQVFKAPNAATGFSQSIAQFEDLLAGNLDFENEAIGRPGDQGNGTFIETGTINYEQTGTQAQNFPAGTKPFPGVEPTGDPNNFAVAITGYLELEAGLHRFGFRHDDGFRLTTGPFFEEQSMELAMVQDWDGGSVGPEFEFLVEADGVYATRLFFYEIGGGAYLEWYSIDPNTGDQILINDTSDSRSIRAFQNREGEPQIPEPGDGVPAPSIVWNGNAHVISWQGTGFTLERADELTGPWEALSGQASPYTETENTGKRFYRLRQN